MWNGSNSENLAQYLAACMMMSWFLKGAAPAKILGALQGAPSEKKLGQKKTQTAIPCSL